ncbi:MAG: hypothetical protein WBD27_02565 [Pyrinomonadaceae bacterium]
MSTRELPDIRLDKTKIAVVPIDDRTDEIEYWRNASTKERLQHAERLRRIAYGDRAKRRLQRSIEIVKLEER